MGTTSGAPDRALFVGGGRVGADMAAVDWAATPVGEPATWPTALRTTVRMVLTSRFSMWMAWGPELTFFYNDAYWRDTLRAKHPWALGRPAQEVWGEVWDEAGPRVASVLESGVATWDEDLLLFLERSGYPEETYHTFSYSPLAGEDGTVRGILCVVTESTDRVIGDRRMATLRDLASAMSSVRSRADVVEAVERTLAGNDRDLPFSLVYLQDPQEPETGATRLAATTGTAPGSAVAPVALDGAGGRGGWPLARLGDGRPVVVDDLAGRFGDAVPRGAWERPPTQAVLVPLRAGPSGGEEGGPAPAGALVVGINPHRPLDERLRSFLQLAGAQITAGLAHAGGLEAEQRRAQALTELDRAKTDFFANVSHEFRTPLTLMMGPLEELRADPDVDPVRWRAELETIHRNGLRLGRLVTSLLDFSRLQAGRLEARYVPTDLGAVTAELAAMFRSAMQRAGLAYVVDCPPVGEPVLVDRDAWEKVVLNLLSNALKFTLRGTVTVRVRARDDGVVLEVADTGVGVASEQLPHLFERFHRVEGTPARSSEGSGIGLALARELVVTHGGDIDVASTPGAGTTFTVTVPFGRSHLPAEHIGDAPPETPPALPAAASFVADALRWLPATEPGVDRDREVEARAAGGRVLVVDDNADMRDYLRRLLAARHQVQVAVDGEEALAVAVADPPDLVVSDVMMPRRDGLELLAALRADERTARVPVVLLSARAGQEAAVEGLAAEADDYVVKPFAAPDLLARVDAHLRLGRARRHAEDRFTAMADLAPALIWAAAPDGARVFHNRGWRRFTGREGDDLGHGWTAGLHPGDRARYAEVTGAAMAAGRGWEIEYRLRRADGAHHWVVEQAAPLGGASGWVGSCVDVNARWVEAERQRLLARVGTELEGTADVVDGLDRLVRLLVEVRLAERVTVRRVADGGADAPGREAVLSGGEVTVSPVTEPAGAGATRALARRAPHHETLAGRSSVHVPLVARERPLAVLTLQRDPESPAYTADDRELLAEVAGRAALALDNTVLLADERAAAERLTLLQRVTAALSAVATPAEVGQVIVAHVRALFGPAVRIVAFEYEPDTRVLAPLAAHRYDPPAVAADGPAASLVGTAVASGEARWVSDDPEHIEVIDPVLRRLFDEYHLRGATALPLVVAGRTVGALGLGLERPWIADTEWHTLRVLAEPCAMALDRARLYRAEHRIADTLQRSLLPRGLPAVEGLALAARYLPGATGTQAGGDWYDVVELGPHRVAIAVGDVVGQGTPAAAAMGQLRIALTGYLLAGHGPGEALDLLDRLTPRIPGARASTAMCLILDTVSGELRWARAGHLPAVLLEVGEAPSYLDDPAGHGPLLGLPPDRRDHGEAVATLGPGAALLLYTDGLVERRGESLDEGLARLLDAAERHRDATPQDLATSVLEELGSRSDDVALVVARRLPPPLEVGLPADPSSLAVLRRRVAAWARGAGTSPDALDDLQLALGEAATNAVEHAYRDAPDPGTVAVRLVRRADGGTEAEVRDQGAWRPPPADPGHRGRGLLLLRRLTLDTDIDTGPGGTRVRFVLAAVPGDAEPAPTRRAEAPPPVGEPAVLTVDDAGPARRLVLRGDLDLPAATAQREPLLAAVTPERPALELDLRGVGYLASAGVGLVLEALAVAQELGVAATVRSTPGSPPARVLGLVHPE